MPVATGEAGVRELRGYDNGDKFGVAVEQWGNVATIELERDGATGLRDALNEWLGDRE